MFDEEDPVRRQKSRYKKEEGGFHVKCKPL